MTWPPDEALSLMPTFIEALPRSRCPISALHRNDAIHNQSLTTVGKIKKNLPGLIMC